jgi:hypothetical protein
MFLRAPLLNAVYSFQQPKKCKHVQNVASTMAMTFRPVVHCLAHSFSFMLYASLLGLINRSNAYVLADSYLDMAG